MELLGDVVHRRFRNHFGHYRCIPRDKAQVEARFGLFADSAIRRKIGARFVPNVP
jgi:hypothetical protein